MLKAENDFASHMQLRFFNHSLQRGCESRLASDPAFVTAVPSLLNQQMSSHKTAWTSLE
jgi:hypothetical protein